MKNNISDKLKTFMFNQSLSIQDVAVKAGLSITTVKNVLYKRSHKSEYVVKIAKAFALPVDYFFEEKIVDFDLSLLKKVLDIILKSLAKKEIEKCPKNFLNDLVEESYKLLLTEQYSDRDLEIYIYGHLDSAINQKLLVKSFVFTDQP